MNRKQYPPQKGGSARSTPHTRKSHKCSIYEYFLPGVILTLITVISLGCGNNDDELEDDLEQINNKLDALQGEIDALKIKILKIDVKIGDGHVEIITIGPYLQRCHGAHGERDCLMEYKGSGWEFFYESVEGFDFQPGFIYTLKVRISERRPLLQDVGRYVYHLLAVIEKKKAPDNFSYDSELHIGP